MSKQLVVGSSDKIVDNKLTISSSTSAFSVESTCSFLSNCLCQMLGGRCTPLISDRFLVFDQCMSAMSTSAISACMLRSDPLIYTTIFFCPDQRTDEMRNLPCLQALQLCLSQEC